MSPREKLLGSAIAALFVLMGGYFAYGRYERVLTQRRGTVSAAQQELDQLQRTIDHGTRATQQLRQLSERSLPADREIARSLYQRWLLDLVDRVGFDNPTVRAVDRRLRGTFYERLNFDIDASATLPELISFLHGFYSSADLHRIQMLNISPIKDSRQLKILISIDAVILPTSVRKSVGDLVSERLEHPEIDPYMSAILERSMFFPANQPPRLQSRNQTIARGQSARISLAASDPDELDRLRFALEGDAPDGLRLDATRGELSWTPRENGSYEVAVRVTDDGLPNKSDVATVRLTVEDPPPPQTANTRPSFDEAEHTYLVATISADGKPQAWISVRTRGRLMVLRVGDNLQIGTIDATVREIHPRHIVLDTDDGTLNVNVGDSLAQNEINGPRSVRRN